MLYPIPNFRVRTGLTATLFAMALPASAHVKWLSRDADCAMAPLTPLQALDQSGFAAVALLAFVVVALAAWVDGRLSQDGSAALAAADRLDGQLRSWLPVALRWGLAAFFLTAVPFFGVEAVYLTPELHTRASWVPVLQLSIAAALTWRRSAWLGALGIFVLYAAATSSYGWYHLLDYPVFLGAAIFIALDSLTEGRRHDIALAVLRVSAGATLMWAAAEKWLYPWWSTGVLDHELSAMRGDMSSSFVLVAAGWVEFSAAFAIVAGGLGTQIAAAFLMVLMAAAVPAFGAIDGIGHAPFLLVLAMLALTRTRLPKSVRHVVGLPPALRRGLSCVLAGLAMLGAYWGLQALAYRTGQDRSTATAGMSPRLQRQPMPRQPEPLQQSA